MLTLMMKMRTLLCFGFVHVAIVMNSELRSHHPKGSTLIAILSSYLSVEYIGVEHDRILQVLSCSETL
jgi:hypothetical protein